MVCNDCNNCLCNRCCCCCTTYVVERNFRKWPRRTYAKKSKRRKSKKSPNRSYRRPPQLAPKQSGTTAPVLHSLESLLGLPTNGEVIDDEDVGGGKSLARAKTSFFTHEPTLGVECINANTEATLAAGFRHDPAGITWLPQAQWDLATWDGVTTYDPCTLTASELCAAIWPGTGWIMRGSRALFESMQPFKDNSHPTVAEIENWNIAIIQHYRTLLGISHPIENDRALYLQAHFSDERKYTTYWDTAYPGTLGSSFGPCVGMSPYNQHCGSSFIPSCSDQTPFLYPGEQCVTDTSFAEGVFGGEQDWPWFLKLSRVIRNIVCDEGITGHGGPFVSRSKVGMSFKCDNSASTFGLRIKWGGTNQSPCS